ncbi:MAG: hypothetical protein HQK89_07965 [Nitrospirae bacterium]|nr:hypothetical protein [Nitrospirota bacterium]
MKKPYFSRGGKVLLLLPLFLLYLPHAAYARDPLSRSVDDKIERLTIDVDKSLKSGKITPKEAARLRYRLENTKQAKAKMKAGRLGQVEYYNLSTVLDSIEYNLKRYKKKNLRR